MVWGAGCVVINLGNTIPHCFRNSTANLVIVLAHETNEFFENKIKNFQSFWKLQFDFNKDLKYNNTI